MTECLTGSRRWLAVLLLAAFPGCTLGEAAPERPGTSEPVETTEPGPEAPEPAADAPGGDATALGALEQARTEYEDGDVEAALSTARELVERFPRSGAAGEAALVAARSAFALRRYDEAARWAESAEAVGGAVAESARDLRELARDALEPAEAPVVLGAILPRTGSEVMVRYGDWLLEGIELAVSEAETREGRRIELVVADDAGGPRTREAMAELERRGALAVIGPLLPGQVSAAAGARWTEDLVMVSPTVPEDPVYPNVYSVNSGGTRGARELGRYAAAAGIRNAAVLYPRQTGYDRKARAFTQAFQAGRGRLRATIPYDSGTTTFGPQLRQVLSAMPGAPVDSGAPVGSALPTWPQEPGDTADPSADMPGQPFAVFIAAPPQDVRQMAPQVAYYGLDSAGVQVLGDDAWASGLIRRVVPAGDLEGVIATSRFLPERADGIADPDFVRRYEQAMRRSLENELPALGYDAAHLILQALPRRMLDPMAVALRFRFLAGLRGATGTFAVRGDEVIRTPYLVEIRNGSLVPAPAPHAYQAPRPRAVEGTGPR